MCYKSLDLVQSKNANFTKAKQAPYTRSSHGFTCCAFSTLPEAVFSGLLWKYFSDGLVSSSSLSVCLYGRTLTGVSSAGS